MAADIIAIQLGLTEGNVYTLWAPQWLEEGEEWEAFLGHGDDLYVFPSRRTSPRSSARRQEHDLLDHPAWDTAADLLVDELRPDDDRIFDIVGVPDLMAEVPGHLDAGLAHRHRRHRPVPGRGLRPGRDRGRSSTRRTGSAVLPLGQQAFIGRNGEKLWNEMGAVIVERWDEVIDALDGLRHHPGRRCRRARADQGRGRGHQRGRGRRTPWSRGGGEDEERDEDLEFWDETGVDCLEITVGERTGFTLRCYLGDEPVFLAEQHRIQIYSSAEDLENYLMDTDITHRLSTLEAWEEIRRAVTDGDAAVLAGPENTYRLDGLAAALREGPEAVDGKQLELGR